MQDSDSSSANSSMGPKLERVRIKYRDKCSTIVSPVLVEFGLLDLSSDTALSSSSVDFIPKTLVSLNISVLITCRVPILLSFRSFIELVWMTIYRKAISE